MASHNIVLDLHRPRLAEELFDQTMLERLEQVGHLHRDGRLAPEKADILITGWDSPPVGPPSVGRQLVAHSGGTIRAIVGKALIGDGLRVSHASAGMAVSVAELCLYYTLAMLRELQWVDRSMHSDRDWAAAYWRPLGRTVGGSKIGVVGASRVGRSYIGQVKALGAEVVVYDPYLTAADATRMGVELRELDDLLRWSDVVAIHAPVTEDTINMIDARRLGLIRDGGALLNTARDAVIDTGALERELSSGRICAALDVYEHEPLGQGSVLWSLPNVILTPHIGARTLDSRRAQGRIVVEEVERYVAGEPLLHEIRAQDYDLLA